MRDLRIKYDTLEAQVLRLILTIIIPTNLCTQLKPNNTETTPKLTYQELLDQIRQKQAIVFDENSLPSDVTDANIQLEKLMAEYEKCPEVVAEREEKRRRNEEMNREALEKRNLFLSLNIIYYQLFIITFYSKTCT